MLQAAMWQDHSAQQCLSVFVWKLADFEKYMALLCQTHSAVTCGNFVTGTSLECTFIWTEQLESMRLVTAQRFTNEDTAKVKKNRMQTSKNVPNVR